MTDVREWVGSLDPQRAGALGFVEGGLGRVVFEMCWTPSRDLLRNQLYAIVGEMVLENMGRQTRAVVDAKLEVEFHRCGLSNRGATADKRQAAAKQRLARAQSECWPRATLKRVAVLCDAVVEEISGKNFCPVCEGHGYVIANAAAVLCANCNAKGVVAVSGRARAVAIGCSEKEYRDRWRAEYEWLYAMLWDAEQEAAREVRRALGGGG